MQMGAKIENFGELFGVLLGEQLGARSEKLASYLALVVRLRPGHT